MHHKSPFVAIDFETADYEPDSACAVALVRVEGSRIVQRSYFLIRPPRKRFVFSYLHGITWEMVAGEPTFGELWPELQPLLADVQFLSAHNAPFDSRGAASLLRRPRPQAAPASFPLHRETGAADLEALPHQVAECLRFSGDSPGPPQRRLGRRGLRPHRHRRQKKANR